MRMSKELRRNGILVSLQDLIVVVRLCSGEEILSWKEETKTSRDIALKRT
jgi:hypothetical protein